MMLANKPACMLILACSVRLVSASTINFFLNNYMKIFKDDYEKYAEYAVLITFFSSPISTFLTGCVVDYFGKKSDMTVPIICMV